MRAVVQRVQKAAVEVGGAEIAHIGRGLVVFVGVGSSDREDSARLLADRIAKLRIFADAAGKFNRSAMEVGAEMLVVSQFTLYADTRKGRRPSFIEAARPEQAAPLIEVLIHALREFGLRVASGQFGAHMLVTTANDGPVTICLDL